MIESPRLEKASKIIWSKHQLLTTMPTKIALTFPGVWDRGTLDLLGFCCGYSCHISQTKPQDWTMLLKIHPPCVQTIAKIQRQSWYTTSSEKNILSFWRFLQRTCCKKYVEVGRKRCFCDVRLQNRKTIYFLKFYSFCFFFFFSSPFFLSKLLQFRAISFISFMGPGPDPEDRALSDNAGYFLGDV